MNWPHEAVEMVVPSGNRRGSSSLLEHYIAGGETRECQEGYPYLRLQSRPGVIHEICGLNKSVRLVHTPIAAHSTIDE